MSTSPFPRGFAYRITNVGSKKSLHGANPTTSPGNVVHRTPAAWDSQRWVFSRVSADDDVYVISNLDSGQVLHGDNLRSGGNARQYPLWPTRPKAKPAPLIACQMWRVRHVGDDTYTLENLDTRAMLTAGPVSGPEGNVTQVAGNAAASQQWGIIADGPLSAGDGLPWGTADDLYVIGVKPQVVRLPVGIGVDLDERMVPNSETASAVKLPLLPKMRSPLRQRSADPIPGFWEYHRCGTDGVSGPVTPEDKKILFRAGVLHDIMYSSPMPDGFNGEPKGSAASHSSSAHRTWKMVADKVMFLNSLTLLTRAYGKARFSDAFVVANRIYDGLFTFGWDAYAAGQGTARKPEQGAPPLTIGQLNGLMSFLDTHGVDDRAKKVHYEDWKWDQLTGPAGGFLNRTPSIALTPSGVTGHTLAQASHAGGEFRQVGTHEWRELDPKGTVRFTFVEQRRDAWSVYLEDPSRHVSIQLDAFRKVVCYRPGSAPWVDLYPVTAMQGAVG